MPGALGGDVDAGELLLVALGSATVAALVSGAFSIVTTRSLVSEQREERLAIERVRHDAAHQERLRLDTQFFMTLYLNEGLEASAQYFDGLSIAIDRAHRRARRVRGIVGASASEGSGYSVEDMLSIGRAVDPLLADSVAANQASLVVFPGTFMQSAHTANRCVVLAEDF